MHILSIHELNQIGGGLDPLTLFVGGVVFSALYRPYDVQYSPFQAQVAYYDAYQEPVYVAPMEYGYHQPIMQPVAPIYYGHYY